MDYRIDETLEYILFLMRHIRPDDLPHAISVLLLEMSFEPHFDGFEYTKSAIDLKSRDVTLRLSSIFQCLIQQNKEHVDERQLEQAIRFSINHAWILRKDEVWQKVLPVRLWQKGRPSNFAFIARIAYLMDLWANSNAQTSAEII